MSILAQSNPSLLLLFTGIHSNSNLMKMMMDTILLKRYFTWDYKGLRFSLPHSLLTIIEGQPDFAKWSWSNLKEKEFLWCYFYWLFNPSFNLCFSNNKSGSSNIIFVAISPKSSFLPVWVSNDQGWWEVPAHICRPFCNTFGRLMQQNWSELSVCAALQCSQCSGCY